MKYSSFTENLVAYLENGSTKYLALRTNGNNREVYMEWFVHVIYIQVIEIKAVNCHIA